LAGSEAAWRIASSGLHVRLYEMRPDVMTPAHRTGLLAELVCSNSLKSNRVTNACGLLKEEMRLLGSLTMAAAEQARVPAGDALAVDNEAFASAVTSALEDEPNVEIVREEVTSIDPSRLTIIATGPLTSDALADDLTKLTGQGHLYFHDAIAPSVEADTIDMSKVFRASRYGRTEADYLNCPFTKGEYEVFIDALLSAERAPLHDFEDPKHFEGCLPIEVMADRDRMAPGYGPMKPVGLVDPRTGKMPAAVVQLRQENREATVYGLVGFQTRLTWPEQERVFRMIPGLEHAKFARLGRMHRNTYVDSPRLLLPTLQLRRRPNVLLAGQITGVEGYIEAAATGILGGINAVRLMRDQKPVSPPEEMMLGALVAHISASGYFEGMTDEMDFQPVNATFGLMKPLMRKPRRKPDRYAAYAERALDAARDWIADIDTEEKRT